MKLKLQNIGIIQDAEINIDGITLIAGQNDTGKSTVGKILYAIVKGFNQSESQFQEEKNRMISYYYQDILKELKKNWKADITEFQIKEINNSWVDTIEELISNDTLPDEFKKPILDKLNGLKNYLNKQYNTIDSKEEEIEKWINSEISILQNVFNPEYKNSKIEIEDLLGNAVIEHRFKTIVKYIYVRLDNNLETYYKNAYFIESPLIIDESLQRFVGSDGLSYSRNRQEELAKSLSNSIQRDLADYSEIYSEISKIINGEITVDLLEGVRYKKNDREINIKNTAVGIKSFGLIQLLLKNNRLNNRTLLIIDEPEVHLHPTWQVKYAEILVRLSKEFEIPMVLTSHSPYFIEALESYSKKYRYERSTNFYFAEKNEDGSSSKIKNVNNNLSQIYSSISEASYKLRNILKHE